MTRCPIALFEAILGFQSRRTSARDCIEFGVYRGRSASVALRHLRSDERMLLIDVQESYPEFDKLRAVNPAFDFVAGKSENLRGRPQAVGVRLEGRPLLAPRREPLLRERRGLRWP
jgi:hypothetical protein